MDAVGPAQGAALDRLIGGDVLDRQGARPRILGHRRGDLARDPTPIEDLRPARRQFGHGRGIGRVAQNVAGDMAPPVRLREIRIGPARARLSPRRGDEAGQARADLEAVARQSFGVAEQGAPRQPTVRRLGHGQHGHRPRRPGRPSAQHRVAEVQRLAVLEEQLGRRRRRRGLAAVIAGDLAAAGVEHHHEGAAAEPRGLRLHQPQHRLHRHRRIDRRAAVAQHLQSRLDRQRIGGGHEGPARERGLDGRRGRRRLRPRRAPAPGCARAAGQRQSRRHEGGREGAQGPGRESGHVGLVQAIRDGRPPWPAVRANETPVAARRSRAGGNDRRKPAAQPLPPAPASARYPPSPFAAKRARSSAG